MGTGDGGVLLGQVTAERRLSIRARRDHAQRHPAALLGTTQEGADDGGALVGVREGRHGEPRVLGQERDHSVDVAVLDGFGEACDHVSLGLGVRQRRPFASGGRQA